MHREIGTEPKTPRFPREIASATIPALCRWAVIDRQDAANPILLPLVTMLLRLAFTFLVAASCLVRSSGGLADEPDSLPDDVVLLRDLRYREGPSRHWTLDLAMPKEKSPQPHPAIIVIHGGGWIEGDKSSFSTLARRPPGNIIDFAQLGFVAATINYRLSGEAPFPAALDDCQCAVRWLRANSRKYNIDPEKIGAWGNSAGGHLALLLGLIEGAESSEADAPYRDQSSRVQAVVSDSGPIDLVYQHRHAALRMVVEKFMGRPPEGPMDAAYKAASPSSYVSAKAPPLMLIYGEADEQVPVETADEFVLALGRVGLKEVSYLRLGGVGHCPHSLIRVGWLVPAVNEFFQRTLIRR